MRWKNRRRGKRFRSGRKKHRLRNRAAAEDAAKKRVRTMQRNELILLTKYREIIRREISARERLREHHQDLQHETKKIEEEQRSEILSQNCNGNVTLILDYLDKVEVNLKSLHLRWTSLFDFDIDEEVKTFREVLLMRFQTYVSELDLSGFHIEDEKINDRCKLNEDIINFERKASQINIMEMTELKRKLKILQDELEEEEIRELACVKVRDREIAKLLADVEQMQSQFELLAVKDDFTLMTDVFK